MPWETGPISMRPEGPRESELDSAERRAEVSRPFRPLPDLDLSFPGHRPAAISPGLRSPGPLGRLKGRFPDTHLYLCWPALSPSRVSVAAPGARRQADQEGEAVSRHRDEAEGEGGR